MLFWEIIFNPTFVASSACSSVTNRGIQVSTVFHVHPVLNGNSLYVSKNLYTHRNDQWLPYQEMHSC
jgi:hypothetical protein